MLVVAFFAFMTLAPGVMWGDSVEFQEPENLPRLAWLPDPLVQLDGTLVTTKEDWFNKRRPELKELVQHYMYGYFPGPIPIRPTVDLVDTHYLGGKATLKLITIGFEKRELPLMHMMLIVPNRVKPAPVFAALDFNGNHALVKDPRIPLPTGWINGKAPAVVNYRATEAGRGLDATNWAVDKIVARGFALAAVYYGDVEPDDKNATSGPRTLIRTGKSPETQWGAVAVWAWGFGRMVDYLVTDPLIDAKRIAVVGHSRLGKAALLAGAFDERVAIVFPHQSGCGGAAPSRGKVGESVTRINEVFPHWFDGLFKKFGSQPDRLPFDQDCVIALCAPRPILITCAEQDTWSNPEGQFEMLKAADKVFRLTGKGGLDAQAMPKTGVLIDGVAGYYIRPGNHSMTVGDWKIFMDFAVKQFGLPRK